MSKIDDSEPRGWLQASAFAAFLFGIAAFFFLLAYSGWESDTVLRTGTQSPRPPRHAPPIYKGVYTREEDPKAFWIDEILYFAGGLILTIGGMLSIRDEYKCRQHQKYLKASRASAHPSRSL